MVCSSEWLRRHTCACCKRQAAGRRPKFTVLICVNAIRLLGLAGSRCGAHVARRTTQNTSTVADTGCLVSAKHTCVLSIKARRSEIAPWGYRRTPSHMSVFQNPVIAGSAVLSDHVGVSMTHMRLLQMPGNWTSAATQGSHLLQSYSLARRG